MHDGRGLRVQVGHAARDADGDRQPRRAPRQRLEVVGEEVGERATLAQLHDHVHGRLLRVPRAADQLDDVGVAQAQLQLALGLEGAQVVLRQAVLVELLARDGRAAPRRQEDLAECAVADGAAQLDLVHGDLGAAQRRGQRRLVKLGGEGLPLPLVGLRE